ncbi:sigma factor-like helix-turn-helix DNA-binding protein [Haloarchaeobius sp. DT45]|uniref:sigma factor-like helix-turn-helix DNA-binding protein n=1 Tax=Haloarchaeobius sp. DT45 TaxID=3446116 RepID=UPI003F6CF688
MDSHDEPTDGPLPPALVDRIASTHGVAAPELGRVLGDIHDDLVDGADAFHAYYTGKNPDVPRYPGDGEGAELPPERVVADGLLEIITVTDEEWDQLLGRFALDGDLARAVQSAHAEYAASVGVDVEPSDGRRPLVLPGHRLGAMVRVGLSRRQAAVQVLREQGLTQAAIADRLGLDVGTVKSHCYRVDAKVREANELLAVVDRPVTDDEQ